jgi:hypothetical protein
VWHDRIVPNGEPLDDLSLIVGTFPDRLAALERPSSLTHRPAWPPPRRGIAVRMPRPTRRGVAAGFAPPPRRPGARTLRS